MPASGLPTSCATPAASLPTVASRSEATSSVWARASCSFFTWQLVEPGLGRLLLAAERVARAAQRGR